MDTRDLLDTHAFLDAILLRRNRRVQQYDRTCGTNEKGASGMTMKAERYWTSRSRRKVCKKPMKDIHGLEGHVANRSYREHALMRQRFLAGRCTWPF